MLAWPLLCTAAPPALSECREGSSHASSRPRSSRTDARDEGKRSRLKPSHKPRCAASGSMHTIQADARNHVRESMSAVLLCLLCRLVSNILIRPMRCLQSATSGRTTALVAHHAPPAVHGLQVLPVPHRRHQPVRGAARDYYRRTAGTCVCATV